MRASPVSPPRQYGRIARLLHWAMAALILSTLLIGASSTTSLRLRPWLVEVHVTLGVVLLLLAIVRLINRWRSAPPALPASVSRWQSSVAHANHVALYGLMLAQPLAGLAMLSAGGYLNLRLAGLSLPKVLPPDPVIFTTLRNAHEVLAYILFALVVLHISAALLHAWILHDGVFDQMWMQRSKKERRE